MSGETPGARALTRLHRFLGVWLGGYLVFHLWEQWPALAGREAWLERMRTTTARPWEIALVLVPLAAHALIGAVRAARGWRSASGAVDGLGRVQAAAGVVVLLFVGYHLVQVWAPAAGPHAHLLAEYAVLRAEAGRPLDLVIYLVGISCVSFHVGHGLARAAAAAGVARSPRAARTARFAAGVAGFALWLAFLHLLGHFAIGEGLLPFAAFAGRL